MKDNSRFIQLVIPGMEKFLAENETSVETTLTTLKAVEDIWVLSPENQNTFHQLEIPGMEGFLAKLKAQSKPTDLSKHGDKISMRESQLEDVAA
jgi:hypothetical protein